MVAKVKYLRLVENTNQETVKVLRALLARAERGEVVGLAMSFKPRAGREQAVFTGLYRTNPAEAALASMRMSVLLTELRELTH